MTNRDLGIHYALCLIAALLVGYYVGQHDTGLGLGAGFFTFLAVSAIQVHDRDTTSNRHNEPPQ